MGRGGGAGLVVMKFWLLALASMQLSVTHIFKSKFI